MKPTSRTRWILSAGTILLLLSARTAHTATLRVPGQYARIGDAVAASQPGDVVVISAGTYREAVLIKEADGLTLRTRGRVRLVNAGAYALTILRSRQIRVGGLTIDGAGECGVRIDDSSQVEIRNCLLKNCGAFGITSGPNSHAVTVARNRVRDVRGTGISIGSDHSMVTRNQVSRCGFQGIIAGGRQLSILDNRISRTGEEGMYAEVRDSLVLSNSIRQTGREGLILRAENSACLDNRIRDAGSIGLEIVEDSVDSAISGNRVQRTGSTGILHQGDRCALARNRVDQARGPAGISSDGDENLFSGNRIRGSSNHGFGIHGEDNTVTRNTMRHSGGFDLYLTGSPNILFQNSFRTSNL